MKKTILNSLLLFYLIVSGSLGLLLTVVGGGVLVDNAHKAGSALVFYIPFLVVPPMLFVLSAYLIIQHQREQKITWSIGLIQALLFCFLFLAPLFVEFVVNPNS